MFQALDVPDVEDIRKYHSNNIESIKMVIQVLRFGLENNTKEYEQLQVQVMSQRKIVDAQEQDIKSRYGISDRNVDDLLRSGNLDIQWMEPIIKSR